MKNKYPAVEFVGTYSPPYGFENNPEEIDRINNLLSDSKADVVIVGLSAPKQEIFVYNNKDKYRVPLSLSLGAAIDFLAGNIKRAPEWINKYGLEWIYRFFLEPKRLFRRYFVEDINILKLFFKYKWKNNNENPDIIEQKSDKNLQIVLSNTDFTLYDWAEKSRKNEKK